MNDAGEAKVRKSTILLGVSVFVVLVLLPIAWFVGVVWNGQAENARQVSFAAREARWIRKNVTAGMTRARAYAVLKSHGLVAYDWAFTKGKRTAGGACNYMDRSSSAWPYRGEPRPRGQCSYGGDPQPNPDATVDVPSGSSIGCGFTTYITMHFADSDRVKGVEVKRESICL